MSQQQNRQQAIGFATILLLNQSDSAVAAGTVSQPNDSFEIDVKLLQTNTDFDAQR